MPKVSGYIVNYEEVLGTIYEKTEAGIVVAIMHSGKIDLEKGFEFRDTYGNKIENPPLSEFFKDFLG